MLRVAAQILPLYPMVQSDLVLAGIFLHDMGKTEELSYDMSFSYTDSGQLIGHISKSLLMLHRKIDELAAKGTAIDKKVVDLLGHIIYRTTGNTSSAHPNCPPLLRPLWSTISMIWMPRLVRLCQPLKARPAKRTGPPISLPWRPRYTGSRLNKTGRICELIKNSPRHIIGRYGKTGTENIYRQPDKCPH